MDNETTKRVLSIIKGIAYTENGGKPNTSNPMAGKSGETKSSLQFMPATWNIYSKQVLGKDNVPITPESELAVAYGKANEWYKNDILKGYTPDQATLRIASRWNAGEQKPDAYKQSYKGVNTKGVSYDTPGYANKVLNYTNQFYKELSGEQPNMPNKPLSMNAQPGMITQPQMSNSSQSQTNPGMVLNA